MFKILIEKRAGKAFKKLPSEIIKHLSNQIKDLSNNPYPVGSRKIIGAVKTYRIRHGDYRVVYEVDENQAMISILLVGHRKDIYRKLQTR